MSGRAGGGGKHGAALTTAPQLHGDSSSPHCSHRREKRQRRRGVARAQPSTPPAQPGRVPASPRGFPKAVQSWQACGDSLEPGRQHRGGFPTVSSTGSAHSAPRCHRPGAPIRTAESSLRQHPCSQHLLQPLWTQPAAHAGAQQLSKESSGLSHPSPLLPWLCSPKPPSGTGACQPRWHGRDGAQPRGVDVFQVLWRAPTARSTIWSLPLCHLPSSVKKSSCSTCAHVVPSRRRSCGTPGQALHPGKNAAHHPLEPKQAFGGSQT